MARHFKMREILAMVTIVVTAGTFLIYLSYSNQSLLKFVARRGKNIDNTVVQSSAEVMQKRGNTAPPFVILMTQWRFGSSAVGQIFNQNSDLFYIFEALWPVHHLLKLRNITHSKREEKRISRDILRGFSKCSFGSEYVDILRKYVKGHDRALCLNSENCRMDSPGALEDFCRTFKGRLATKLIHADLDLLRPLVEEDNINVKIIHLVRDPRGSAASRIDYIKKLHELEWSTVEHRFQQLGRLAPLGLLDHTPQYMLGIQEMRDNNPTARGMCQWIRENIKTSPDQIPTWLKGRYLLVKYEDFAISPLTTTRKIHDFLGMPHKAEVEEWVRANTNGIDESTKVPTKRNVFSTKRDSKQTMNQWMKVLTYQEATQVTYECRDVMELLGYK